ncbi:MAG TPA: porin [Chondromyces sp.]|nr:porin [Chondromyces sp.]
MAFDARRVAAAVLVMVTAGALRTGAQEPTPPSATPSPTPAPAAAAPSPETLAGTFRDNFEFRTADGANTLRIGASFHLDGRVFFGDSEAPTSFDIRRARVDFRGRLRGWMSYRVQISLENEPYIRNLWLDLGFSDPLHLRVGQMKVPFSTSWVTLDNQVNFVERATEAPVYPFFDRGVMLWGMLADSRLVYQLGAYNGSGLDLDTQKGDVDDHKDVALRLFAQPFRGSGSDALQGLYFVAQGTYGPQSVATKRFESGGLSTPSYESRVWRWRLEQTIGTNGRSTDSITAEIGSRTRWGLEAHWLYGPLTVSSEYLVLSYDDISISHQYLQGSNRLLSEPQLERSGDVRSATLWASWFLTGERKTVDTFGWRQPSPKSELRPGSGGTGAWELLARLSRTTSDRALFDTVAVRGYTAAELADVGAVPVGEGESVRAAVLDGAAEVVEATLGANWTLNPNLRIQLNLVHLWVPDPEVNGGLLSAANSDLGDPALRNVKVDSETSALARLIFRF